MPSGLFLYLIQFWKSSPSEVSRRLAEPLQGLSDHTRQHCAQQDPHATRPRAELESRGHSTAAMEHSTHFTASTAMCGFIHLAINSGLNLNSYICLCVAGAVSRELSSNWLGWFYEHYETSSYWRLENCTSRIVVFSFIATLICSTLWDFEANIMTDIHNGFQDSYTKIHGVRFSHWSNIRVVTSRMWGTACVGISMGGICGVRRWYGHRLRVLPNNFCEDQLRHSKNIVVNTSTVREAAVLVILTGRIYGVLRLGFFRCHDIPSFMTIGSRI
jgi:hypothetical protein